MFISGVSETLDPVTTQMRADFVLKLTAVDAQLRESIAKMVRSKKTMQAIGQSAGAALETALNAACRDVIVPAFDRGCRTIYQQINSAFLNGLQDCESLICCQWRI